MSSYLLHVSFWQTYYALAQNRLIRFVKNWWKRYVKLRENDWNNWRKKIFCLFIVRGHFMLQSIGDIEPWGNGSAFSTVTWPVVCWWRQINKKNNLLEQRLNLNIIQVHLIGDTTERLAYWFASHHRKIWRKQHMFSGAQRRNLVSYRKQAVFFVHFFNSTMSSSSSRINKTLWIVNLFTPFFDG